MMNERWKTVPKDFDEACRFATEYEIEGRHAIEAQRVWQLPDPESDPMAHLRREAEGPDVRAHSRHSVGGPKVGVTLKTDRLTWTFELRSGDPYELPVSLIKRFASDYKRLCGMAD
jgi:hypothetical protein